MGWANFQQIILFKKLEQKSVSRCLFELDT